MSSHDPSRTTRPRATPGLIAAVALALCGCAAQRYVRSYTYDYTAVHRLAAERRATQEMQDACYFSGAQYFETLGPPKIIRAGASPDQPVQATQAFYCVGTVAGP